MNLYRPQNLSRRLWLWFLVFVIALTTTNLRADNSSFEAANKLYLEGKFAEAVTMYDQLVSSGKTSEAVYFNRGNALFKQGQLGRAIASYRLAEPLAPRDSDLRANLQLVRTRARGGMPGQSDRARGFLGKLTLNEWAMLLMLAFWVLFILLALAQWRPQLKTALRTYTLGAGTAVVVFGICFAIALNTDYLTSSAIIISGEADVRNGPLDESPSIFKVRDGVELTILDHLGNWFQVTDSAQRVGWVRGDQVIILNHGVEQKPAA